MFSSLLFSLLLFSMSTFSDRQFASGNDVSDDETLYTRFVEILFIKMNFSIVRDGM